MNKHRMTEEQLINLCIELRDYPHNCVQAWVRQALKEIGGIQHI